MRHIDNSNIFGDYELDNACTLQPEGSTGEAVGIITHDTLTVDHWKFVPGVLRILKYSYWITFLSLLRVNIWIANSGQAYLEESLPLPTVDYHSRGKSWG